MVGIDKTTPESSVIKEVLPSPKLMDIIPRALDVDRGILDLFTVLAVASKENRIVAVGDLIGKLKEKQDGTSGPCQEVLYSLKRLIKGLSSPRKLVRVGYPLALCQILRQFSIIEGSDVLQMIEEYLDLSKAESSSEKSNMEIGIALAYSAVIQSDILLKDQTTILPLLQQLMSFKTDKSYVQHIWHQCLPLLIQKMVTHSGFETEIWPVLQKDLSLGWSDVTPERLQVLLICKQHLPDKIDKTFLKKNWSNKKIIGEKTYKQLLSVLQDSTRGHPIIHNVNKLLLQELPVELVGDFWREIGEILFHGELSKRRLGMFLLSELIKKPLNIEQLEMLLSKHICEMVFTDLKFTNKEQPSAQMVLDSLASLLDSSKDDHLHSTVVKCFTKSLDAEKNQTMELHTVLSAIIPHLTVKAAEELSQEIMNLIEGRQFYGSTFTSLSVRQWSINQLSLFFSHSAGQEDVRQCQANLLQYLFRHAFFVLSKSSSEIPHCHSEPVSFGEKLQKTCNLAFVKNFLKIITMKSDKNKKAYITKTVQQIFSYVESLVSNSDVVKPLKELNEETLQALHQIKQMLSQMHSIKTDQSESKNIYAFEILLTYLALQVFCDPQNCLDVIQDSLSCCEKSVKKRVKSSDDEPDWLDVLLDVLIAMMTHPSKLSRAIATSIFSAISDHITPLSLGLLTEILMKKTTDVANDEDFMFDEEEGESEEEDVEMSEKGADDDEDEEEEEEDDDDDDEEEEEEDEDKDGNAAEANMEVDEDFRQKVKNALGDAADNTDDSEEELSDLSDSEMSKYDAALAAAFRSRNRTEIKKASNDKKQQLITLKIRLLDFIEVLIKQNHKAEIVTLLFRPLLELRDSSERNRIEMTLGEKAIRLYRQLYKTKVSPDTYSQITKEDLLDLMTHLIEFSRKAPSVGLIVDVSDGIYFLSKLLLNINSQSKKPETEKKIHKGLLEIFQPSLKGFLDNQGYQNFFCFYQNLIVKLPIVFWKESNGLVTAMSTEEEKLTKRLKAARLLCCMVDKNMHQKLSTKQWKTFVTTTVPVIIKVLESSSAKPKFLDQVMCLFRNILTIDKGDNLQVIPTSVVPTLQTLKKSGPRSQHKTCNSLLQLLQRQGLQMKTPDVADTSSTTPQ
ncbi:myb-binding protein 1A-like protein isoform X2 [Octopus sinensis]|uniref:Myb-binding protein 1A-like protein isoform X2 n=1 Tax=Octopus sinensis TaxID=2607531 RepID=A0A7E6FTI5_9MOLL|nr:myb-binding protein 1A-like protein isoform X2 [Octopus sinensis]